MKKKRAKAKKKSGLFSLRYLLPAGFFLALSVFLLLGLNRNPNEIPSPLIDKAAPEYALPRLADAPASIGRRALAPGNANASTGQASAHASAGSDAKGANDNLVSSQALRGQPYLRLHARGRGWLRAGRVGRDPHAHPHPGSRSTRRTASRPADGRLHAAPGRALGASPRGQPLSRARGAPKIGRAHV